MSEFFLAEVSNIISWFEDHVLVIVTILVSILLARLIMDRVIERVVRKVISSRTFAGSIIAERKREDTLIRIIQGTFEILIWLLAFLLIISEIGVNVGPIIAAAGVVGLAVGFGGQYLIKDLISGFFIILENQYRIGDSVCFDKTCGSVEDISLRTTVLRDLNGTVHHIPHGSVTRVANLSKNFSRVNLDLRISYETNLEKVITIINETGRALAEDENWRAKIIKPIEFIRVNDFGESALILKILGDTEAQEQWAVAGEYRKRLKIAFDEAGIKMPFQKQIIYTKKDQG